MHNFSTRRKGKKAADYTCNGKAGSIRQQEGRDGRGGRNLKHKEKLIDRQNNKEKGLKEGEQLRRWRKANGILRIERAVWQKDIQPS